MITLLLIIINLFRNDRLHFNRTEWILLVTAIPIAVWLCLGFLNGYGDGAKSEIASFASLIIIVLLTMLYTRLYASEAELAQLKRVLYITAFIYVGFKAVIELLYVAHILDIAACRSIFTDVLNSSVMTMEVSVAGLNIIRLGTVNDTIPFVLFSMELICEKRSDAFKLILVVGMALYTIIVFSRVAIAQYLMTVIIAIAVYGKKNGSFKQFMIITTAAIFLMVIIIGGYAHVPSGIADIINARFTGKDVINSDSIRGEQIRYLTRGIRQHPLFGSGLGAYIREYTRASAAVASYEVEYLSFLYQFGVIGFVLIIVPMEISFFMASAGRTCGSLAKIALLFNFLVWAIKPVFNPQFLSSSSGMVIATMIIFACSYERRTYTTGQGWKSKWQR